MKKIIVVIWFLIANISYSQNMNCISDIQLETYNFTTSNLEKINKQISDKNSLIEVSIEINNKKIKDIKYKLITFENNYNGENKIEIKIWKGLNKYIYKTVNNKITNCPSFIYEKIVFRVPISVENINKAIEEVNHTIIELKEIESKIKN